MSNIINLQFAGCAKINGSKTCLLTINSVQALDYGSYDLIIENDAYEIVSHFVKLNIIDLVLIDKLLPNTKEHKKIGVSKKQFLTSFFN